MNQILYTGKGKNKADVNVVLKVFVVLLIIFAICFIALGVYLYSGTRTEDETGKNNPSQTTPEPVVESKINITFSSVTDGVKIKIKSNLEIVSATYRWDDEEEFDIQIGSTTNEIVEEVGIRQGIHTLYVTVIDIEGNQKTEEQAVIGDKEPQLVLTTDGVSNYVIQAKDDEQLSKVVIILNNETILEKELNEKEFEYKVEIPEGDSLIEVQVYNLNNLVKTKKGKVAGFSR